MILRHAAEITKDQSTLITSGWVSCYFTPAIPAIICVGKWFLKVMQVATMVFGAVVVRTVTMPAPPAFSGDFINNFPAIMASVHYF